MLIKLVGRNKEMIEAWKGEFINYKDIQICNQSIFDISAMAIVSPANSLGIMDGGWMENRAIFSACKLKGL